eukprot:gene23413-28345_t
MESTEDLEADGEHASLEGDEDASFLANSLDHRGAAATSNVEVYREV